VLAAAARGRSNETRGSYVRNAPSGRRNHRGQKNASIKTSGRCLHRYRAAEDILYLCRQLLQLTRDVRRNRDCQTWTPAQAPLRSNQ
jgi:hypothetical protein